MSTYHLYYLGYKTKDGMFYPLGPFDNKGKLHCVIERSGSFASDLYENFYVVPEDKKSSELINAIYPYTEGYEKYETWNDWEKELRYLPIAKLGSTRYIKSGFYLISDIKIYEEGGDCEGFFYNHMSPTEYSARVINELTFGEPKPQLDDEGEPMDTYTCRDYSFYAYPDYTSREYEAFLLTEAASMFDPYDMDFKDGEEIVALYRWS